MYQLNYSETSENRRSSRKRAVECATNVGLKSNFEGSSTSMHKDSHRTAKRDSDA